MVGVGVKVQSKGERMLEEQLQESIGRLQLGKNLVARVWSRVHKVMLDS